MKTIIRLVILVCKIVLGGLLAAVLGGLLSASVHHAKISQSPEQLSSNLFNLPIKTGYLDHRAVVSRQRPGGEIVVRCYDKLLYHVCPDPLDKRRAEESERMYYAGMYVGYDEYEIDKSVYDDPAVWS